ncbi:MAG TPA: hypothetical protein VMR19_00010 [Candidatus Saccharimonadales bacterium]|nr:hypothetical protein [Candidatus Saccharimonadales bacterium]
MLKRRLTLVGVAVFFVVAFITLTVRLTNIAKGSSLTAASLTMSNSRLSYKAQPTSGAINTSLITISGTTQPDINTGHLFPGDVVCFTDAGQNGCIGNTTYTVDSIVDGTHFNLNTPLTTAVDTSGWVIATQSGTWTIAFTNVAAVPIGGSLTVSIPMADNAKGANGIPDSSTTIASSGFDLGTIGPANVVISGCTPANWGVATIATGSGVVDHLITFTRSSGSCAASTAMVVTIGGPGVINPAPLVAPNHTQGVADVYGVTVTTKDGGGYTLDSAVPRAAPIEAVLVSATVDEALSFQVQGMTSGSPYCGNNASVSASATSIPWGHFTVTNGFVYADQQLTVSTNATSGYVVTLSESDQMGRNGNVCTGSTPSVGNYTFGTATCIRDTTCSPGGCTESVMSDWTDPVGYVGLGYSLASQSGTDAIFWYNQGARIFNAKALADIQGGKTAQAIMSNTGPVNGNSIYVCYKIAVPGTQPSGYYYNIAKYTATATF